MTGNNEALNGVGLEDKEIQLYTSLLEAGETTVLELAKKSGVKRPAAYVLLPSLEAKGFVTKTVRGKKTFWIAQPPRKLISEAEFRLAELKEVVPQLESLLQKGSDKPRVIIYEGREALDRSYDDFQRTRFIPKEFVPFQMDIGIFGNRTLISSIKKDYFTVSIESNEVANA